MHLPGAVCCYSAWLLCLASASVDVNKFNDFMCFECIHSPLHGAELPYNYL